MHIGICCFACAFFGIAATSAGWGERVQGARSSRTAGGERTHQHEHVEMLGARCFQDTARASFLLCVLLCVKERERIS